MADPYSYVAHGSASSAASSGAEVGAAAGTAIAPGIGSLLGAAAGGLIGLGIDTWSSDRSREKDQADYQENQLQNFMYGQQAQRNAASNEVAGLMKAGLNPALAGGVNAAPMTAAPLQNKEAPKFNPGMAQLLSGIRLQDAQTENIKAQTEKANSEKNLLDLNYERELDFDETMAENMPRLFFDLSKDPRYSPEMRKFFENAAKDALENGVSKGAAQAISQYLQLRVEQQKRLIEEQSTKFDWNLLLAKMDDPYHIKALVRMPEAQRQELLSASANYMQNVALMVQTAETEKSKREMYAANALEATRQAQKIFHSDNAQMMSEGEVQGIMWNLGASFMESATKVGTAAVLKH